MSAAVDEIEGFLRAAHKLAEAVLRKDVSQEAATIAVAGAALATGVDSAAVMAAVDQIRREWQAYREASYRTVVS